MKTFFIRVVQVCETCRFEIERDDNLQAIAKRVIQSGCGAYPGIRNGLYHIQAESRVQAIAASKLHYAMDHPEGHGSHALVAYSTSMRTHKRKIAALQEAEL